MTDKEKLRLINILIANAYTDADGRGDDFIWGILSAVQDVVDFEGDKDG